MHLDAWKTFADIIESFLKSTGLILAAFWAYRKLFILAEHETSISSGLQAKILPCSTEHSRMIEIRTTLTNHGKVPCQIDLAHSKLWVWSVVVTEDTSNNFPTWGEQPYFQNLSLRSKSLLNIPVGAAKDEVQFVVVPHPGAYHIRTFFAQTEQAVQQFYHRMKQPLPPNFRDNPSGWSNEVIIWTGPSKTSIVKTDDKSSPDGV